MTARDELVVRGKFSMEMGGVNIEPVIRPLPTNIINVSKELSDDFLKQLDLSGSIPFAEGWYGSVYGFEVNGKDYVVKVFKDTVYEALGTGEAHDFDYMILGALQGEARYPKLHAYKHGKWMIAEYIEGIPLRDVEHPEDYFDQLYEAYVYAIAKGWFPDDVKGENILVNNDGIKIIDVGAFVPYKPGVTFDIQERVEFVIGNAKTVPSRRDKPVY